MPNGPRAAVCGTSTSSTLPSMVLRLEINGGSAIAQLGIHGIAKRVAEQTEPEHAERDRNARKDRDPWRRGGEFLGAALQHQSPGRDRTATPPPGSPGRRMRST